MFYSIQHSLFCQLLQRLQNIEDVIESKPKPFLYVWIDRWGKICEKSHRDPGKMIWSTTEWYQEFMWIKRFVKILRMPCINIYHHDRDMIFKMKILCLFILSDFGKCVGSWTFLQFLYIRGTADRNTEEVVCSEGTWADWTWKLSGTKSHRI